MAKINLKNHEKLEVNQDMILIADSLGRPVKFAGIQQFKLYIKHVYKHHAGYDIYTSNGIISIENPRDYTLTKLYYSKYEKYNELIIFGLSKLMWNDGLLIDMGILLSIPTETVSDFKEYVENEDSFHYLQIAEDIFKVEGFDEIKDLQEEIKEGINWKTILEFRSV